MDLRSGHPFWLVKNGLLAAFPTLHADLTCDVAVIGAGITYSMIAARLIAGAIMGHPHPDAAIFRFDR